MKSIIDRIRITVKNVIEWDQFIEKYKKKKSIEYKNKLYLQVVIAFAFFLLSIANVFAKSYFMLFLTLSGCLINIIFAALAKKRKKGEICSASAIATCSVLFAFFVINGGNDGFACLWVILLPFLSMVVMNFRFGFYASIFFQVYLFAIFWTPLREKLLYRYNDQFCLRFPLFFFVTFLLGLLITISLRRSEYNECKHLIKLEEMTAHAYMLARTDPLTKLANRRSAYEKFDTDFSNDQQVHCIVMSDIDGFKKINDTYGHEFGDQVLVEFAKYAIELFPESYLISRWGGEEFLLATNEPIGEVYKRVEKFREFISNYEFDYNSTPIHITATFGIAEYSDKNGVNEAINTADARLYAGKSTTKNCTVIK